MLIYGGGHRASFELVQQNTSFLSKLHTQVLIQQRSIGHQNYHNLKENMLKYMNNSIRTYLDSTPLKLKVLSKLWLNILKTV